MKSNSAILRILLHGFFLISVNLFSVMAAVVLMRAFSIPSNGILQSGIVLAVDLGIYILIYKVMNAVQKEVMRIDDISMLVVILLTSLALFPAVFYPIHYVTKGYWNSFENILAIWPFQLMVNGICLVMNYFIITKSRS
jgi:hypothetical protein